MPAQFDVIVIGTGAAAGTVAVRCADAGRSVAVIDERPFGGTCALRGCDPKKVLRRAAEVVDAAEQMRGKGIEPEGIAVRWRDLMAFKRGFTDPVPAAREKSFGAKGIESFHDTARFVGPAAVSAGGRTLEGRHIVVASGAEPAPLPIEGAELMADSDDFLELETLPPKIVFIGGGFISFEFAHIAARAGAQVVVLDDQDRPLQSFDPDLVDRLVERGEEAGVVFRPAMPVSRIEAAEGGFRVHAEGNGGQSPLTFDADLVVHGAGRRAAVEALDPAAAGVEFDGHGIKVDGSLRSISNPRVFAAGDAAATPGMPLTPVAAMEGRIVARNLLEDGTATPDYRGIPSAVYTIPPLAAVGLLESEARESGFDFDCRHTDMSDWYSVRRVGETHAVAKVLTERGSGRILGAHFLGPGAEELVNIFGFAMRNDLGRDRLEDLVSAYPSAASDIGHLL